MASPMITRVTEFIRENYSADGIDVVASADGHIVCALPEEVVDLGGVTDALEQRFGCLVDMRQSKTADEGYELVVHVSKSASESKFAFAPAYPVSLFELKRNVAKLMGVLAAGATIYLALRPSLASPTQAP